MKKQGNGHSRFTANEIALLKILSSGEEISVREIDMHWYRLGLSISMLDRTKASLRRRGFEIVSVRRSQGWTWKLTKSGGNNDGQG